MRLGQIVVNMCTKIDVFGYSGMNGFEDIKGVQILRCGGAMHGGPGVRILDQLRTHSASATTTLTVLTAFIDIRLRPGFATPLAAIR